MTENWTKTQLEALAIVTGEADREKAYAILIHDGTLIEQHRQLTEGAAPDQRNPAVLYVVEPDAATEVAAEPGEEPAETTENE